MNLLSIQSHVAYGHVGNSAAVFALQRLGIEVWPVHTVQLSNHRGYDTSRGRALEPGLIREIVQGLGERGVLAQCDGVLSGYLGSAEMGEAVLDAVAAVKRANPKARYCCDPVLGDVERGAYVAPGVAEFMRQRAVPLADILTPNHFELDALTGWTTRTLADALAAIDATRALGPQAVLVTSLAVDETPADAIDLVASDGAGCHRLRTPRLPIAVHGAGDAIAALFFAHDLRTGSAAEAMSLAASSVFGVIRRTADAGSRELLLVEAQHEIANPSRMFRAEAL